MSYIILFGGSSFEHEISIVSAITLKEKLAGERVEFIFLDKDREFYQISPDQMKSRYFASGAYKKGRRVEMGRGGFYQVGFLGNKKKVPGKVVINLIHGRDGEDGKIPGMLSFYRIKAITPPVEGCAISYNKVLTKYYASGVGVKVVDWKIAQGEEPPFPLPVIIKPARLGSSIGVSVAKTPEEYRYGLDVAREFDPLVIVEPFIEGVEEFNLAGCWVNDQKEEGEWLFSRVEPVKKREFLDYNQKYLDFSRRETQVAPVDPQLETQLKEAFKKIYGTSFRGALIRCDFFRINGEIYLNEINPIPGSLANYLFEDFLGTLRRLAQSLQLEREIEIDYRYINQIQQAKGK
jgi:D-alanine-D-alanine ligase